MRQSVLFYHVVTEDQCCSNKMENYKYSEDPCQKSQRVLLFPDYLERATAPLFSCAAYEKTKPVLPSLVHLQSLLVSYVPLSILTH